MTTNKFLTIAAFLLTAFSTITAQTVDVDEWYPQGTTWEEVVISRRSECISPGSYQRVRYEVKGDSIIEDKTYKKIVSEVIAQGGSSGHFLKTWSYALRENEDTVYIHGKYVTPFPPQNIKEEFVRYIKKNWQSGGLNPYGTRTIGEVFQLALEDGNMYDCTTIQSEYDTIPENVIKTIGSNWGILCSWNLGRSIYTVRLTSFTRNGVKIYSREYPFDTSGINEITNDKGREGDAYTIQGIKLKKGSVQKRKGLVVQNGKKIIR